MKQLQMTPAEIVKAIKNGEHKENYEKWARHKDAEVRLTLARQGYFPEIFVNDRDTRIKITILQTHPESAKHFLRNEDYYIEVNMTLERVTYPDIKVLEQHLEDLDTFDPNYPRKDMETKLAALIYEPTPLEKTMTPIQLYKADSPLWAYHLTPDDISYILEAQSVGEDTDDFLQRAFINKTAGPLA